MESQISASPHSTREIGSSYHQRRISRVSKRSQSSRKEKSQSSGRDRPCLWSRRAADHEPRCDIPAGASVHSRWETVNERVSASAYMDSRKFGHYFQYTLRTLVEETRELFPSNDLDDSGTVGVEHVVKSLDVSEAVLVSEARLYRG